MNNCNECIHNKVCKLVDISKRIKGKLIILFDEIEKEYKDAVKEQFEVEIKCKDFELVVPRTRGIENPKPLTNTDDFGFPIWNKSNPCEGCLTYKMLKDGKVYLGDLPCQWCSKNPLRVVTCISTTATK